MVDKSSKRLIALICWFFLANLSRCYVSIETEQLVIHMPLVETTYADQYICYAMPLHEIGESYVLSSMTVADRTTVHHAATGVCERPATRDRTWDCTRQQGDICTGKAVNFGGWDEFTKKNGVFRFPPDVSLKVGTHTSLRYLIMEIHFTEPVKNPQYPVANVTLTFAKQATRYFYTTYTLLNYGFIPGNTEKGFLAESACVWNRPSAYAFRYFLHTHHYGFLVEGFLIRNGTWSLLGSQLSMDKKKMLYDVPGGPIEIRPGDILAARCLYVNKGEKPVKFGMSEGEEMCNFQLDIGYLPEDDAHFLRPPMCRAESPTFSFCDHEATRGLC